MGVFALGGGLLLATKLISGLIGPVIMDFKSAAKDTPTYQAGLWCHLA